MTNIEKFLVWYYKHHNLVSAVWAGLGWASLLAVAVLGKDSRWFTVLLLLWYAIFCISPSGCASALIQVFTEYLGII